MTYSVDFLPVVFKQLRKLGPQLADKLTRAAFALAENPRPHGCLKLTGLPGWRVWVGCDLRLVYEIDDARQAVLITDAGWRRDMY